MKKLLLGLVLVLLGVSSYGVLQMEAAPTRYRNQAGGGVPGGQSVGDCPGGIPGRKKMCGK